MRIEFRRTGERRYAVTIHRLDQSILEMNPAAGYDPLMPHDLLHYVVESELGLRSGIFGQIARGGNAGTFHLVPQQTDGGRRATRRRRRLAKRGAKLLREGREDATMSERAVYLCLHEWLARRADPELEVLNMRGLLKVGQKRVSPGVYEGIPQQYLDRMCARLDSLGRRWASLDIGESIIVDWSERR
jgi:hypothetical protein